MSLHKDQAVGKLTDLPREAPPDIKGEAVNKKFRIKYIWVYGWGHLGIYFREITSKNEEFEGSRNAAIAKARSILNELGAVQGHCLIGVWERIPVKYFGFVPSHKEVLVWRKARAIKSGPVAIRMF